MTTEFQTLTDDELAVKEKLLTEVLDKEARKAESLSRLTRTLQTRLEAVRTEMAAREVTA